MVAYEKNVNSGMCPKFTQPPAIAAADPGGRLFCSTCCRCSYARINDTEMVCVPWHAAPPRARIHASA
eukprot:358722-Chlamydomonas_euryale.AAC.3